jgi:hypothetical protein
MASVKKQDVPPPKAPKAGGKIKPQAGGGKTKAPPIGKIKGC